MWNLPEPEIKHVSPALAGKFLPLCQQGRPTHSSDWCVRACLLSNCSCVRLFATLWTVACQAPLSKRILQARILEWVAMPSLLQGIFPTQGSNPCLLDCRWILSHLGSPFWFVKCAYKMAHGQSIFTEWRYSLWLWTKVNWPAFIYKLSLGPWPPCSGF